MGTPDLKETPATPARVCEVCGADTSRDRGRCTNGRCSKCHATHCTPGGDTGPGHGRGPVPTPYARGRA